MKLAAYSQKNSCFILLTLVSCTFLLAACAAKPVKVASSAESASAPTQKNETGAREACKVKNGADGVLVACISDNTIVILPGQPWTLEPGDGRQIVHASRGFFHASAQVAPESETQYGLQEHLGAIYAGIARDSKDPVSAMRGVTTANGRLALLFEVEGLSVEGKPVRSIHVWTALRRPDRRYVDFHTSWTGPADDPELTATTDRAALDVRLVNSVEGFVTVDAEGHSPPQD